MKPISAFLLGLVSVTLLGATSCFTTKDPAATKAGATKPASTPVPAAIDKAGTNAVAALVAMDKKYMALQAEYDALKLSAAKASAQTQSANIANTNQPPSPATQVVDRETKLAMTNLPPPDVNESLEATRRRLALLEGRTAEAEALYKAAQSEADRMKAEQDQLKAATEKARVEAETQRIKAAAAQADLVNAERRHAADLEKTKAENQAKLDDANRKADEAVKKAYEERHNLLVRILIGIGALSIIAGIGMAIATSGASAWRSGIAVFCGLICFGLAQVLSHPWFNIIFSIACGLIVIAVGIFLWRERVHTREAAELKATKAAKEEELRLKEKTLRHVVSAVEEVRASNPEANAALTERLDYHTSPDSTRPAYIKLKSEVTT